MKKYRIILLLIVLFIGSSYVMAEDCDDEDIGRLKVLASNIDITYEKNDNYIDAETKEQFSAYEISFDNVSDEFYIYDDTNNIDYYYIDLEDGKYNIFNTLGGKTAFQVYSRKCEIVLKTFNINLDTKNEYSENSLCEGHSDLDICNPNSDTSNISEEEFYKILEENGIKVNDNNNDDNDDNNKQDDVNTENNNIFNKVIDFLTSYYIYIIGGLVLIVVVVAILVLRHRKRSVLE